MTTTVRDPDAQGGRAPLKSVLTRRFVRLPACLFFALCLSFLSLPAVHAAAPKLEPVPNAEVPGEVKPGQTLDFSMTYTGDPPSSLSMVVQTPAGETIRIPTKAPAGDTTAGVPVSWRFTPEGSGSYKYHFEASAGDIGSARYPTGPSDDPQFVAVNLLTKYLILMVGLGIGLLFLPFVVYLAARSANRQGDPGAAARIALLIGVIASYALFLYLFASIYGLLLMGLAGIVTLGILIALFSRRKAV